MSQVAKNVTKDEGFLLFDHENFNRFANVKTTFKQSINKPNGNRGNIREN
jgi:hypothetical protein